MRKRVSAGVLAAVTAVILVAPVASSAGAAELYDCRMFGPAYVSEAMDCVRYILQSIG